MKTRIFFSWGLIAAMLALAFTACGSDDTNPTTYAVTIINGSGSGSYQQGETVYITATVPTGQLFINWTVNSGGIALVDANSQSTSFTMPANAVTVTANFSGVNNFTGTWTNTSSQPVGGYNATITQRIVFSSNFTFTLTTTVQIPGQSTQNETSAGTYTYNGNSVTCTFTSGSSSGSTYTGSISGNILRFNWSGTTTDYTKN